MTVEAVTRYLREKTDELTDGLLAPAQAEVHRNLVTYNQEKLGKVELELKAAREIKTIPADKWDQMVKEQEAAAEPLAKDASELI